MLSTPHTMVGIAIAAAVPDLQIAAPMAFCAHYLGDLVPHWDLYEEFPTTLKKEELWKAVLIFADTIVGITLGLSFTLYALWVKKDPYTALKIFVCGILAVMPDAMYVPILFLNSKNPLLLLNYNVQKLMHYKTDPLWGNLTQIIIIVVAFLTTVNLLAL